MFSVAPKILCGFLLVIFLTHAVSAQENLALHASATNSKFTRSPELAVDGIFAPEGAAWNSAKAIAAADGNARLVVDLGKEQEIALIILQADGNDTYIVDFSSDQNNWAPVWHAPPTRTQVGLQRRVVQLAAPLTARYVRVRAGENDGSLSIAELQLFSKPPTDWSELIAGGPSQTPWQWSDSLDAESLSKIKALVAAFGLMIVLANSLLRAVARSDYFRRTRRAALIGLAIFAAALWSNIFQFHFNSRIHAHEFYHYYLGSKYSPELGYMRLYRCTIAADRETNIARYSKARLIRNLDDNTVVSSQSVEETRDCKQFFSPSRWLSFTEDLKWFRAATTRETYTRMQLDHGYNATPVWGALGFFLSNMAGATETNFFLFSLLDPLLLSICAIVAIFTFGIEATCVAVIFFGTNFIANFSWTGGAFLRLDWLAWCVVGLCLLKLNRPLSATACLTYAGLLRIFPFAFLSFVFLQKAALAIHNRSLEPLKEGVKPLIASVVTAIVLIALSSLPARSLSPWGEFAANTSKHLITRSTNMIGLEPVLVARSDNSTRILTDPLLPDPFSQWKQSLDQTSKQITPTYVAICIVFMLLVARRLVSLEQWQAAALGITLLPLIHLSNYDYYFLVVLALLGWRNQVSLLMLAWLSWVAPDICRDLDRVYILSSVLCVITIAIAPWLTGETKINKLEPAHQ